MFTKLSIALCMVMTAAMPAAACDPPSDPPIPPSTFVVTPAVHFSGAHGASPMTLMKTGVTVGTTTEDGTNSVIMISSNDNGQRIQIEINNDKVSAKVNGEEVPADRIQRDEKSITILDADGKVIYSSPMVVFADEDFGFATAWDPFLNDQDGSWLGDIAVTMEAPKVMLGVHMEPCGPALEKQLKIEKGTATLLTGVYEGLPAHTAGVQEYDVIISIDGQAKADPDTVREVLRSKEPGAVIAMEIIQAGERKTVSLTLEAYDAKRMRESKLLGAATEYDAFFGPGGFNTFRFSTPNAIPGAPGAIVIDPNHMRGLREAPLAAAEVLRERANAMTLRNRANFEEQIAAMQKQLEEMNVMIERMVEEANARREKQEDRQLAPNES